MGLDAAPSLPFAALLRRYRLAAGLSQEELAERAHLSVQAIGALERGIRRAPYRATVDLLAGALGLTAEQREQFRAAVSRRRGAAIPPARPDFAHSNLPRQTTSFVGREQEQATVLRLLESSRLLTLTGTGGVGKTRLAMHVATGLLDRYPDGVWLVELAALPAAGIPRGEESTGTPPSKGSAQTGNDPALVPQAAALALGITEQPGRSLLDLLADTLRDKRLLLILDNCEHLREAAGELAEALLRAGPGICLLATSREALGIVGETVWWVPSLAIPDPASATNGPPRYTAQGALRAGSVQLFCDRAAAAHAAFLLTDTNVAAVAAICRRLDGIPLAIELAAARARILTAEQIAARLDARFRLLTRGREDALPRQQALRATLDWSYDLLTGPERLLLQRLSVFAGGCEIEAAESVCAGDGVGRDGLFDLLTSLIEKSLLVVEYRGDSARYRLLETVRQYAGEKLAQSGEADAVQRGQRAWALELAEQAATRLHGPEQVSWLERLDAEHDNLRAVLQWALDNDQVTPGLRLAGLLADFWRVRGYLSEARQWLERLLAGAATAPADVRAAALYAAAIIGSLQGDYSAAQRFAESCLALRRQAGDDRGSAMALHQLGVVVEGRLPGTAAAAAAPYYEQSLSIARTLGDPSLIRPPLYNLGSIELNQGEYTRAEERFREALDLARDMGDSGGAASNLTALGFCARLTGALHQARPHFEEALRLRRQLGDRPGIANTLRLLADLETASGELHAARAHAAEALSITQEIGHAWGIVSAYDVLTMVARKQGDFPAAYGFARAALRASRDLGDRKRIRAALWEYAAVAAVAGGARRAVRIYAASDALGESLGVTFGPDFVGEMEDTLAALRDTLGDEAFSAAWAEGTGMSPDQAVAHALSGEYCVPADSEERPATASPPA